MVFLIVSDVHSGHKRNPFILDNLKVWLKEYVEKHTPDYVFFLGDFTDGQQQMYSKASLALYEFIRWYLHFAKSKGIVTYLLNGTPSHDWKQHELFRHFNNLFGINAIVYYIDKLSIVTLENGLNALFIPDRWNGDSSKTLEEVYELLKERNLDQVDYTFVHGEFDFQLPVTSAAAHSSVAYLAITRYFIHTGHIHNDKTFDRIISTNSFDRIRFGESERKGGVLSTLIGDQATYQRLYNDNALPFITINSEADDLMMLYSEIERVGHVKSGSQFKIIMKEALYLANVFREIDRRYPTYIIQYEMEMVEKPQSVIVEYTTTDQHHYTPESLYKLLVEPELSVVDSPILLKEEFKNIIDEQEQ